MSVSPNRGRKVSRQIVKEFLRSFDRGAQPEVFRLERQSTSRRRFPDSKRDSDAIQAYGPAVNPHLLDIAGEAAWRISRKYESKECTPETPYFRKLSASLLCPACQRMWINSWTIRLNSVRSRLSSPETRSRCFWTVQPERTSGCAPRSKLRRTPDQFAGHLAAAWRDRHLRLHLGRKTHPWIRFLLRDESRLVSGRHSI